MNQNNIHTNSGYNFYVAVSMEELKAAMRCWATGVTVVTAFHDGVRHGMTVSSFTSVSLTPPMVLISLERTTRTRQFVTASGFFGVNLLGSTQEELSNRFAGRISDLENRFEDLDAFVLESGAPMLADALAWMDCRVSAVYEVSTHSIIVGEVIGVKAFASQSENLQPLIYYDRGYRALQGKAG